MDRLKLLRKENKKSQKDIAEILFMSQSNYGKLERNEIQLNTEQAKILANYYNVSISYMLNIDANEKNKDIERIENLLEEIKTILKKL